MLHNMCSMFKSLISNNTILCCWHHKWTHFPERVMKKLTKYYLNKLLLFLRIWSCGGRRAATPAFITITIINFITTSIVISGWFRITRAAIVIRVNVASIQFCFSCFCFFSFLSSKFCKISLKVMLSDLGRSQLGMFTLKCNDQLIKNTKLLKINISKFWKIYLFSTIYLT